MKAKKAIPTCLRLVRSAKASRNGALERLPSSFSAVKAGLSASLVRSQIEIASSTADSRNGTRQPQAANASSPSRVRVRRITPSAAISPKAAEDWIQLVA